MKTKVAILGSTGSIGKNTLQIIDKNKQNFKIELLSTNKNIIKIYNQAKKFKVKNIIIHNKNYFEKYFLFFKKKKITIFNSVEEFSKRYQKKIDYTMSSIIGLDGLEPTLQIIKKTKNIAIANKESIICGWHLIKKELKKHNTIFFPVDSEHFSLMELIKKNDKPKIKKIYITASGGPFLKYKLKDIIKSNPLKAIQHPNWKMGKKISVDSATLMNKVFELIEAKKIFDLDQSYFDIIIQPTSYVHCVVEFKNGVTKFLTHPTSMKIPIYNSFKKNDEKKMKFEKINFDKLNKLNFQKVDYNKFPINLILNKIPNNCSLFETILVSANDTLVELFLKKKISFYDIYRNLNVILNSKKYSKYKLIKPKNLSQILNLSKNVRLKTKSLSVISKI